MRSVKRSRRFTLSMSEGWRFKAACRNQDTDLFFIVGNKSTDQVRRQEAMNFCWAHCSVRLQCLLSSLEAGDTWGVFGGYDMEHMSGQMRQHLFERVSKELGVS